MAHEKAILAKITRAKREVLEAEEHLTNVLGNTRTSPRAEKTAITERVRDAIAKLKAARLDLEDVDRLLAVKE